MRYLIRLDCPSCSSGQICQTQTVKTVQMGAQRVLSPEFGRVTGPRSGPRRDSWWLRHHLSVTVFEEIPHVPAALPTVRLMGNSVNRFFKKPLRGPLCGDTRAG